MTELTKKVIAALKQLDRDVDIVVYGNEIQLKFNDLVNDIAPAELYGGVAIQVDQEFSEDFMEALEDAGVSPDEVPNWC